MNYEIKAGRPGLTRLLSFFESEADSERMLDFIKKGWNSLKWQSPNKDKEHRDFILAEMKAIGMDEIWKGNIPADGVTSFGGWIMPCRYQVKSGVIEVVKGVCKDLVLFDYNKNPTALMLRSGGTNGEVTAELIVVDGMPGGIVKGKIILLSCPDLDVVRKCFLKGALGVISDIKPHRPEVQEGAELDNATAWLNYAMPPWLEDRGFGVTITPADGQRIRSAISSGKVILKADIKAKLAKTEVPVVSAVWPGGCKEEVVITGHIDEIGADDNLSGVAVSLEFIRIYRKLVERGVLKKPLRGLRLIFGPEVYGVQSYLSDNNLPWNRFKVGLNVDTVGTNQEKVNSWLIHGETFPTAPHCVDSLMAEILDQVRCIHPRFRYAKAGVDYIDNGISDPDVGAPTPQIYHFTLHHHTSLDRPEYIDPVMLCRAVGITGAYSYIFATPDENWSDWLARVAFSHGVTDVTAIASEGGDESDFRRLLRKHQRRIASTDIIMPLLANHERNNSVLKHKDIVLSLSDEMTRVTDRLINECTSNVSLIEEGAGGVLICKDRSIYRKKFRGMVGTESLLGEGHKKLRTIGYKPYWGAPIWLVMACFLCDGNTTTADIWKELTDLGYKVNPEYLSSIFNILEEYNLLKLISGQHD